MAFRAVGNEFLVLLIFLFCFFNFLRFRYHVLANDNKVRSQLARSVLVGASPKAHLSGFVQSHRWQLSSSDANWSHSGSFSKSLSSDPPTPVKRRHVGGTPGTCASKRLLAWLQCAATFEKQGFSWPLNNWSKRSSCRAKARHENTNSFWTK